MLTDNKTNTVFKYFWVNSFKWRDTADRERFAGHPKEKTLYRGWLNTDTNTNRIYYKHGTALWFDNLITNDSDTLGYTSDIREINITSILDTPLVESDLDIMIGWLETDNKDIKDIVFPPPVVPMNITHLIQEAIGKINGMEKEFDDFIDDAGELMELDKPVFDQIWNIIRYSLDTLYGTKRGPLDADYLSMDKTRAGLGFNIGKAQESIFRYASTDRKTNENPVDLLDTIYTLLTELKRREHHNLNEE